MNQGFTALVITDGNQGIGIAEINRKMLQHW
jgi:hypothetical protein